MSEGEGEGDLPDYVARPDGSLLSGFPYLCWNVGDDEATLDGEFTAAELRAIADYMDRHSK